MHDAHKKQLSNKDLKDSVIKNHLRKKLHFVITAYLLKVTIFVISTCVPVGCDDDCICNDDIIVHIPPSTHAGVSTNLAATTPETTTTGNLDMDSTPMGMGGNETNSTTTETTPETTAIPYCTQGMSGVGGEKGHQRWWGGGGGYKDEEGTKDSCMRATENSTRKSS